MNELDQIRDAYPTQPPATPEATQLARTQLQDLARTESTRRRRLPAGFTPIRLGIGLTTAAATVAVVALGVPLLTPDADPGASQPPAVGTPDQSTTAPAAAPTARQILLVAAAHQERAEATTGKYFRVRTAGSRLIPAGRPYDLTYALEERSISESWTGKAGGTAYRGTRDLGVRPATPADEAKWRAAGSPTTWNFGPTDTVDQHDLIKSTQPSKGKLLELETQADRYLEVGGPNGVTTAQILALPTTPEALSARLLKDKAYRAAGADNTSYLVSMTTDLLLSTPATPKTRAAGLRLLAGLPGAVVKENVRDLQGRTGTSITFAFPKYKMTTRLIVDPKTGIVLSTSHTGGKNGSSTVLASGWTNETPAAPSTTIR